MPVDDRAAQAALDELIIACTAASAGIVQEGAEDVQRASRLNLKDAVGELAMSITITGPDPIGAAAYEAEIGPTAIYGRQRELGGPIDPISRTVLTAAFRDPGYWMWDYGDGQGLREVFTHHVFQVGQHYLKRGLEEMIPEYFRIAIRRWGAAIRSIP
jgi:hypothetical protein